MSVITLVTNQFQIGGSMGYIRRAGTCLIQYISNRNAWIGIDKCIHSQPVVVHLRTYGHIID